MKKRAYVHFFQLAGRFLGLFVVSFT
jgi:hypothetical protein